MEAMIRAVRSPELAKIYQSIIYQVATLDYPVEWPGIADEIINKL